MVGAEDGKRARLAVVENCEIALLEVFDRFAGRVANCYVDLDEARIAAQNYASVSLGMQRREQQAKRQNSYRWRENRSGGRVFVKGDHEPVHPFSQTATT